MALALALAACASGTPNNSGDDGGPGTIDAAPGRYDAGLGFGEPCAEHGQCESGLCYHPIPDEPGYCTENCDDLCPDGYACKTVTISEGVDARLCVPAVDTFCRTCDDNSDCGDSSDLCIQLTDGKYCSIDCSSDATVCPSGFTCAVIQGDGDIVIGEQCKPLNGLCCIDKDGDFRGQGDGCRDGDCDDDNPEVYDDAVEVCDGFDNDCVGGIDVDVTDCLGGSCRLGALGYYETPAQLCVGGSCEDQPTALCDLYTCSGGGDVGNTCATACDVEDDGKCIPAAHCDASACLDDLVNGEVCDEASDCQSDHCQNGFCCNAADCCQAPTDCPSYGTFEPVCENPATCQGSRGEATCVSNMCGTTGDVADDSGCDATVESNSCGWYVSVYCNGDVSQTAPTCPTSCTTHADCDPNAFCDPASNTCVEDLNDGLACAADSARCKSGHCQNGFCCASGDCCESAGDCPGSYSTAPVCEEPTTCQGTRDVAQCISSICSTLANEPDDSACAGTGGPASDCGPYLPIYCDGSIDQPPVMCPTACATDAACDAGAYCTATGVCAPDQPNGSSCNDAAECQSGYCNNGFCCGSGLCCATGGDCNSLDEAAQCDSQSTCQGHRVDGVCSPTTFQCSASTVDDDSGCAGLQSNDCGLYPAVSCTAAVSQPTDQASRCASTCAGDPDCDPSGHCEAPTCVADVGPGGFCNFTTDCSAGLVCEDNVCCTTTCGGTCRACDLAGSEGTCTSVADGDDPDAECGAVGCSGYYYGWVGDTCYQKLDVSAGGATCGGDAMCRSVAEECTAQTAQGPAAVTCDDTCQDPTPGSCTGTSPGACTNVNPGTISCGTGECRRTVDRCVGGADNTCTAGMPSGEICDGKDNDCDGPIDEGLPLDGYESNNTCGSHYYLGNKGEGTTSNYSTMTIYTSGDVDWYRVRTTEASDACVPFTNEGPYHFRVDMTPPTGKDYDLEVCWADRGDTTCGFGGCASSTAGGSTAEWVQWNWTGSCGSEDGLEFYVHVYGYSGANSCYPYNMQVSFTKD